MKKQILILMGVGALTYASANLALLDTNAALTAPTNWTFKYTNQDFPGYKLRDNNGVLGTPLYTRTADGIYWNYTTTFQITQGLNATQTFNRSNTTWYDAGSGNYVPSASAIGSDNTVGGISNKVYLHFSNQTNKDYKIFLDYSSSPNGFVITFNNGQTPTNVPLLYYASSTTQLYELRIYAYSTMTLGRTSNSSAAYLDAWYLQDLGVSASYQAGYDNGYVEGEIDAYDIGYNEGYDEGYADGLSLTGMGNIFELAFNTVSTIFNIQVLGTLTLGTIVIAPIAISLLWFILGIVSGVGTGGKKK